MGQATSNQPCRKLRKCRHFPRVQVKVPTSPKWLKRPSHAESDDSEGPHLGSLNRSGPTGPFRLFERAVREAPATSPVNFSTTTRAGGRESRQPVFPNCPSTLTGPRKRASPFESGSNFLHIITTDSIQITFASFFGLELNRAKFCSAKIKTWSNKLI